MEPPAETAAQPSPEPSIEPTPTGPPAPPLGLPLRHAPLALGLGFMALGTFFFVGQLAPGILAAIGIAIDEGGQFDQATFERRFIPLIPWVVLWGASCALVMTGLLGAVGWLAPSPERRGALATVIWVVVLSGVCFGGQQLISLLMEMVGLEPQEQEIIEQAAAQGGVLFFLGIALLAPIGEELVFRRILFATWRTGTHPVLGHALSALFFGLIHLNMPSLPLYIFMGLCFSIAYERTGTIWAAIAVHAINNTVGALSLMMSSSS